LYLYASSFSKMAEYKAYPPKKPNFEKTGYISNTDVGKSKNRKEVLAVVDHEGNECWKTKDCEHAYKLLDNVPPYYKDYIPIESGMSFDSLSLILYQHNCGSSKCTKDGNNRVAAYQLDVKKVTWRGDQATVKTGKGTFKMEVGDEVRFTDMPTIMGIKLNKRIEETNYPRKILWVRSTEAAGSYEGKYEGKEEETVKLKF
jgi:hypothetical protein